VGVAAAPAAVISAIVAVVVAIDDPNITRMGVSCNIFGRWLMIDDSGLRSAKFQKYSYKDNSVKCSSKRYMKAAVT
jgi:hypothetical protein